ncbi:MAG: hypothetical protein M3680_29620, partial [Myxococcota bacterium]|nr:hypothetical protein [Myxococcota bacterium]
AERLQVELRATAALRARVALRTQLVAFGARARPPMPAVMLEQPGPAPFDGARWIAGTWGWTGTTWAWTAGGWTDADRFGDAGGEVIVKTVDHAPPAPPAPPAISVGVPVAPTHTAGSVTTSIGGSVTVPTITVSPTITITPGVRVIRDRRSSPRGPTVRDQRKSRPRVRDHR